MSESMRISRLPAALGFVSCLILVLNLSSRVAAQAIEGTQFRSSEQSDALIAGWIAQGERRDFPWKFSISEPNLYYDQTSFVSIRARIPLGERRKMGMGRDFHFIVKVADETGQWLDRRIYDHRKLDSGIPSGEVIFGTSIGFRPGQFRIAIIVYDALAERRNVTFRQVTVHQPGTEPFPELLSRIPRVSLSRSGPLSFPVATQRPIQLDLVIEFSTEYVRRGRLHRQVHEHRLLEPARILTRLDLENGCIRLTGLDSFNLRTVIPSQPASSADFGTVAKIYAEDRDARVKVSADELATHANLQAATYFHNELERIIATPPCSFSSPRSVHVVAILTTGVDFIRGTPQPRIESKCNCRILYLRAVVPQSTGDYRVPDRLKSIVEPLSPKVFEFDGPLEFRPKFFEFIAALKNLSTED